MAMINRVMPRHNRAGLLVNAAMLIWVHSASAQDQDAATAVSATATNTTEDILVTARKSDERLQDVPISISAVTSAQLAERGAVDVKDVLRNISGLAFSGAERGLSNYNIRGVSTVASAPTVAIFLDDI